MRKTCKLLFRVLAAVLLLLAAAVFWLWSSNRFTYTNLAEEETQQQFQAILEDRVPQENIDLLISQINTFNSTPYQGLVESGWKTASIPFHSYRDKDGFTHLDTQPDNLINCRMTAFLLIKSHISFAETEQVPTEKKDPQSRIVLSDKADLLHYDLLYADLDNAGITSSEALVQTLTGYWQEAGISFDDSSIRLITAYGFSGNILQNFHTAVAIYTDDCIWLFEKYDPIHPYQLSCFEREADMVSWMKKRVRGLDYAAIFSNGNCLWYS